MKFFTTFKLSENMHETPEGFLVCVNVPIARVGEMTYGQGETPLAPGPDGRVIISRDQKEVFRKETMASFEGKPVTILHPDEFVDPENWAELTKGIVQNVRRGEGEQNDDLVADLLITESGAINLVRGGLREVSCGYEAEYTQTGVGRGVQTNIVGNHLALVEMGRAGSSYSIKDHAIQNGEDSKMKLSDQIKKIFGKAQDEALALVETKDDGASPKASVPVPGMVSMDDMKSYLDEKFESLAGGKKADDASTRPTQSQPAQVEAGDEEAKKKAAEDKRAARDKYIDDMMAKDAAEKEEKAEDEEPEEETDAAYCGDDGSRVEILAPGMEFEKNYKVKALLACYKTKDGKEVINQFTGGKELDVKNAKFVDAIFVGASEILKGTRSDELADAFSARATATDAKVRAKDSVSIGKTPEEMNEANAKFYGKK